MRSARHAVRNHLAVAIANIEAFIDGKLVPTPDRLGTVLHALHELDGLISDIRITTPTKPTNADPLT